MGLTLRILGSSSSGNCALLSTPRCNVLVDAGLRINRLKDSLEACGVPLEKIDAVFLTHDHSDHTVALQYFRESCAHIPIFANELTWSAIRGRMRVRLNWKKFETGQAWDFADLAVQSFEVPHDACDPTGFVFAHHGERGVRRIGWVTDLGYVTELVKQRVREVDVLALESNYERHLLDNHPTRPLSLKTRVKGRHGHLSNEDAFALLESAEMPNCRQVYLIHISRECNTEQEAVKRFAQASFLRHFTVQTVNPFVEMPLPACEIGW